MKNSGVITVGQIALVSTEFRPIAALVACNSYTFYNDYALYLRTDTDDSTTELLYGPGQDPSLIMPAQHSRRFACGSVIIYGKWQSQASGVLKCVFAL